jgi:hypothetical protein
MCDYSLGLVNSRPARLGDRLVSTGFKNTVTRGLSAADQPEVAVCLLSGTEVAFDRRVRYTFGPLGLFSWHTRSPLARFRQINRGNPHVHHDAFEFADGRVISLQDLGPGQQATVLQLPSDATNGSGVEVPPRPAAVAALPVQGAVPVQG